MKKWVKRTASIGLMTLLACSSFAGCFTQGDGGENSAFTSEQKQMMTELKVGVYEGGLGYEWANELRTSFQEMFKDVSFEEGKKGVYVTVEHKKVDYENGALANNIIMGSEKADVYINTDTTFENYVEKDVAYDITTVLSEKVYDANGELTLATYNNAGAKSIKDRMNPYFLQLNNFGTEASPKYYNLPYEWGISGFIYDRDLLLKPYVEGGTESLLKNADGTWKYDGYDGTPRTTTDFIQLLNDINDQGMIGFTYSMNDAPWYWKSTQSAFLAQYEGEAKAMLNLTFDGTATFPAGTFDAQTCAEEGIATVDGKQSVQITDRNAWLLGMQGGKTEYAKFMRNVINPLFYDPAVTGTTQSFDVAQSSFVSSILPGNTRIAMLVDGEWWENETRQTFENLGSISSKYAWGERDFRFMPVPQAEGGENDKYSFFIEGAGPCFINKNTTKFNAAKLWVQYMYSNYGCNVILKNTGLTLPFDFTLDPTTEENLTPFQLSTYNLKKSDEVKIFMASSKMQTGVNRFAVGSTLPMTGYSVGMQSRMLRSPTTTNLTDYVIQNNIAQDFTNNLDRTAEDWVEGLKRLYNKADWTTAYNTWFNN